MLSCLLFWDFEARGAKLAAFLNTLEHQVVPLPEGQKGTAGQQPINLIPSG